MFHKLMERWTTAFPISYIFLKTANRSGNVYKNHVFHLLFLLWNDMYYIISDKRDSVYGLFEEYKKKKKLPFVCSVQKMSQLV